jgi:hypothetical protein
VVLAALRNAALETGILTRGESRTASAINRSARRSLPPKPIASSWFKDRSAEACCVSRNITSKHWRASTCELKRLNLSAYIKPRSSPHCFGACCFKVDKGIWIRPLHRRNTLSVTKACFGRNMLCTNGCSLPCAPALPNAGVDAEM